jgi:soluble P-type ATPase
MIDIDIPGFGKLHLEHLVLDYNGTLAIDGEPIEGVAERLKNLSKSLTVHVVTADTFGKVVSRLDDLPCRICILPQKNQAEAKLNYIQELGVTHTVCAGNGRNDRLMLEAAALGIAVIQEEGAAYDALSHADIICPSILSALDLLTNPLRLVASLRS